MTAAAALILTSGGVSSGWANPTYLQPRITIMQITWYGHSAFRLDFAGKGVLIDPFFTGNPAFVSDKAAAIRGVTHIVLTHGHSDHVGDALDISAATGAPVIANYDLCKRLAPNVLRDYRPLGPRPPPAQDAVT